ncbi:hypothetical protein [Pantoea phage vB_PagP-SK1]|uniref:Uncharacterized protein n=1 Tax=Pantoea phage vB_PagP-SK1 TaxID=2653646 RepID=A0A5P8NKA5_9CAUD|nr:hypothetical protein [Pantoea phage vB_PagP-SK1]
MREHVEVILTDLRLHLNLAVDSHVIVGIPPVVIRDGPFLTNHAALIGAHSGEAFDNHIGNFEASGCVATVVLVEISTLHLGHIVEVGREVLW